MVGSRLGNLPLTNCSSRITLHTAGKRSCAASDLTTKPNAPILKASCAKSGQSCEVKKMILEPGETLRICRATSRPLRSGSPISSRTKSGCSSALFRTASKPSELSKITSKALSSLRIERKARRHGSKSSDDKNANCRQSADGLLQANVHLQPRLAVLNCLP